MDFYEKSNYSIKSELMSKNLALFVIIASVILMILTIRENKKPNKN